MFWYFSDFCVVKQILLWFQRNLMVLYTMQQERGAGVVGRLKFYQNSISYEIKNGKNCAQWENIKMKIIFL